MSAASALGATSAGATSAVVLTPSPAPANTYPLSVAVSQDGNTIAIGDPEYFNNNTAPSYAPGTAYVFVRTATLSGWSEAAVLSAPPGGTVDDGFGQTVAVSSDGSEVVVGAPGVQVAGDSKAGAAYVFTRPARGWSSSAPVAELTASDADSDEDLGDAVAVSGGTVVAAEEPGGNVYVFSKPAGGWTDATQTAEITEPGLPGDCAIGPAISSFGDAVAIDGNTLVVGYNSYQSSRTCNTTGAALVYERPPSGWSDTYTPTATLEASDGGVNNALGQSVAVQGATVVAGAPDESVNGQNQAGAVYVFKEPAGGWADGTQSARLVSSKPHELDTLGTSVGISGDEILAANSICPFGPIACPFLYRGSSSGWRNETQTSVLTPPVAAQPGGNWPPAAIGGETVVQAAEFQRSLAAVFDLAPVKKVSKTSAATIRAALSSQLVPTGRGATIEGLLRNSGYTFRFKPPTPGRLSIRWFLKLPHETVTMATGSYGFGRAVVEAVNVRPTSAGFQRLGVAKHLSLEVAGTFTPLDSAGVTVTRSFNLS